MTTQAELHEVHAIIAALERCKPKNDGDRRFLESWRGYLNRTGDDAAIGRWRPQQLRRVARSYGLCQVDETAQLTDLTI